MAETDHTHKSKSIGEAIHNWVSVSTDVSVLLRELGIVVLICMLFFAPRPLGNIFGKVGITKIPSPFGDIDLSSTGDTVSQIDLHLQDGLGGLAALESKVSDPTTKGALKEIHDKLLAAQGQAQTVDTTIKTQLAAQQTQSGNPVQSAGLTGWIFCGQVDRNLSPAGDPTNKCGGATGPLKVGDKFALSAPAYVRGDVGASQDHTAGKITGLAAAKQQVQVIQADDNPDYTRVLGSGGWFLWVKVQCL